MPNPPGISNLTPVRRHIRASIAANARWSREDPAASAARGQAGLLAKFEREAREHGPGLTDAEYARRAESARKAHMARLAFASSKARDGRRKAAPKAKEATLAKVGRAGRDPVGGGRDRARGRAAGRGPRAGPPGDGGGRERWAEGWAGWELPAAGHLRSVAEILAAPPTPEERRALRREQAEAEARRASAADTADNAAAAAFMARVNGTPPRDVLAEAAAEPTGRDRTELARRRAAIDVLTAHGLQDVITGGQSGVVFDPHLGILEPEPDLAQRAAMDAAYVSGRSERQAEERREAVNRARGELLARRRARGLASRAAPAAYLESRTAAAGARPLTTTGNGNAPSARGWAG